MSGEVAPSSSMSPVSGSVVWVVSVVSVTLSAVSILPESSGVPVSGDVVVESVVQDSVRMSRGKNRKNLKVGLIK